MGGTKIHLVFRAASGVPLHLIVCWGGGTLSPSSAYDARSVGRGSSLRNPHSSNHLHATTLRTPLSEPPPAFICVAPAGLTVEQFPGGAGGKYISLIKDIWWLFYMLSALCQCPPHPQQPLLQPAHLMEVFSGSFPLSSLYFLHLYTI